MADSLNDLFTAEMREIHERAKVKCQGYRGTRFEQMIQRYGGVDTAKRLLAGKEIKDGFTDLLLCRCPELTAEALVLKPEYETLFSPAERQEAARRLGRDK